MFGEATTTSNEECGKRKANETRFVTAQPLTDIAELQHTTQT